MQPNNRGMLGNSKNKGFFLTDEEIKKIPKFNVDLYAEAGVLLKTRGDFTLEELINSAFLRAYNGTKLYN